jgi:hypothetical protein
MVGGESVDIRSLWQEGEPDLTIAFERAAALIREKPRGIYVPAGHYIAETIRLPADRPWRLFGDGASLSTITGATAGRDVILVERMASVAESAPTRVGKLDQKAIAHQTRADELHR